MEERVRSLSEMIHIVVALERHFLSPETLYPPLLHTFKDKVMGKRHSTRIPQV